jgi:hypothetical protein
MNTIVRRLMEPSRGTLLAVPLFATLALLVVLLDVFFGFPAIGVRATMYANIAGLLVTAILAVAYSRHAGQL